MMPQAPLWLCSHCRQPLAATSGMLTCVNHHSFDVAHEGYVNLLAGRQKSGLKGDTPAMLAARRQFFDAGFYEPLRQRLEAKIATFEHAVVAEVGCGEGFYVGGISEHLNGSKCLGLDIAKAGVRLAAKRYPMAQWAVADTNTLIPLPTAAVDVVLDIFAPRNAAEFARVVRSDGRVIVVIPTERHLAELRAVQPLLAIQADKRRRVETALGEWFGLAEAETLTVPLRLAGPALAQLVAMTPNAWFLTPAQQTVLAGQPALAVTAEFELLVFRRLR